MDSVIADCGTISGKFRAPMEKGIAAGKVSARAMSAQGAADRAAEAATGAAEHANSAAAAARDVGGTLAEGAADDAEAAATEAETAGAEATSKSVDAATAIADVDAHVAARTVHEMTDAQLGAAKEANTDANEAAERALLKAKIAHEQAGKAEKESAKTALAAGDTTKDLKAATDKAQVDADRTIKTADGSAAKAAEEAAYAQEVSGKMAEKYDLEADPVMKAVAAGLDYEFDNATSFGEASAAEARNVETAWTAVDTAAGPIRTAMEAQDPASVTGDEQEALQTALDELAAAQIVAEKAAEDAEHYAKTAHDTAKKEEFDHVNVFLQKKKSLRARRA